MCGARLYQASLAYEHEACRRQHYEYLIGDLQSAEIRRDGEKSCRLQLAQSSDESGVRFQHTLLAED